MDCVVVVSGRCGGGTEMRGLFFCIHMHGSLYGTEPEEADRKKELEEKTDEIDDAC